MTEPTEELPERINVAFTDEVGKRLRHRLAEWFVPRICVKRTG